MSIAQNEKISQVTDNISTVFEQVNFFKLGLSQFLCKNFKHIIM